MTIWLAIYLAGVVSYYYVIYASIKETETKVTPGIFILMIFGGVYSWISWAFFYWGVN